MIRQSSSAGPWKYLNNQDKKLCKIFARERKKKEKKNLIKNTSSIKRIIKLANILAA